MLWILEFNSEQKIYKTEVQFMKTICLHSLCDADHFDVYYLLWLFHIEQKVLYLFWNISKNYLKNYFAEQWYFLHSCNLSSQKKFTIFVNFKFSKQLRYSVIFYKHQAALFRLHLPFSTRDATRLHSLEPRAASFTLLSGNQAFDHLQFSIAFYK